MTLKAIIGDLAFVYASISVIVFVLLLAVLLLAKRPVSQPEPQLVWAEPDHWRSHSAAGPLTMSPRSAGSSRFELPQFCPLRSSAPK